MDLNQLESSTVRKVTLRLIPFLAICFAINILDKVNIGFAALQMNQDLNFSGAVYGFGAGIFFIGYFAMGVPGSAIMTKIGARKWISILMITWAAISYLMVLIKTPLQFYGARFLLGAAEASFYPCMVWYLSNFYQAKHHAKAIAGFMLAIPAANAIGSPLSSYLLGINLFGLGGWQTLFAVEGFPCLILGIICYFYLDDKLEDVKWLNEEEKNWLIDTTNKEKLQKQKVKKYSFGEALKDRDVIALSIGYFGWMTGYYGIVMFLPTISKGLSQSLAISNQTIGWIIGFMYLCSMITMIQVGNHSDKKNERKLHVAACLATSAIALVISAFISNTSIIGSFIFLTISLCGAFGAYSPFWSIPPSFLTETAAAAAIAFINSVGNLGGFVGSYVVGYIKDATGSFTASMIFLGCITIMSAFVIGVVVKQSGKAQKHTEKAEKLKVS